MDGRIRRRRCSLAAQRAPRQHAVRVRATSEGLNRQRGQGHQGRQGKDEKVKKGKGYEYAGMVTFFVLASWRINLSSTYRFIRCASGGRKIPDLLRRTGLHAAERQDAGWPTRRD